MLPAIDALSRVMREPVVTAHVFLAPKGAILTPSGWLPCFWIWQAPAHASQGLNTENREERVKPKGYLRLFLAIVFLTAGYARAAEISAAKQEKLGRLLELMRLEQSLALGTRSCIEASVAGPHSPDKVWAKEGKYHGLTPKSDEWPQALAAFRRFSEGSCASGSASMYKQMYVNFYGTRLDEKDIDSVIRYMESPAGQVFTKLQDEFQTVLSDEANRRSIAKQETAREAYWKEINLLAGQAAKRKPSEWWKFWK